MSVHTGQGPVQTVPACPVQIRAHHHIDFYTDINETIYEHWCTTKPFNQPECETKTG